MTIEFKKYKKHDLDKWQLVSDVCAGSHKIKAAGNKYLPELAPGSSDPEDTDRYKQYLERAVFAGFVKTTLSSMIGIAFKKEPSINAPVRLQQIIDNANGDGISLAQSARSAVSSVMKTGRSGLLTDYPHTEGPVSVSDEIDRGIRPTITRYNAKDILNWRTQKSGSVSKLSLVVLCETYPVYDGFEEEVRKQYRVLSLEDGLYVVRIYRDLQDGKGFVVQEEHMPRRGNGQRLTYIPFRFIGAQNNDAEIDEPPLFDLSVLSIAHYRNSADYEEGVFICGQPWVYVAGIDDEWFKNTMGGKIKGGAANAVPLPSGGSLGIEQAQPNSIAKEAMDQKEEQMVAMGARLIEQGSANKTATQANSDEQTNHSVLSLVCENVSHAYTHALMDCADMMNIDGAEIEFTINVSLGTKSLDAQALTALVSAWMSRAISRTQLTRNLRKLDLVDPDKTDEDLLQEIEDQEI